MTPGGLDAGKPPPRGVMSIEVAGIAEASDCEKSEVAATAMNLDVANIIVDVKCTQKVILFVIFKLMV